MRETADRTSGGGRVLLALAGGFLAGLVLAFVMLPFEPNCETEPPHLSLPAPDGGLVATVRQEVCSDGWFVTIWTNVVEVAAPDGGPAVRVARVSETDSARSAVALEWTGPRSLRLRLVRALGTEVFRQTRIGVAIELSVPEARVKAPGGG